MGIKAQITEVREKLADKENMTGEEIKKTVSDLQQSSLKLFEMAYKKMAAEREGGGSGSGSSEKQRRVNKQKNPKKKISNRKISRRTVKKICLFFFLLNSVFKKPHTNYSCRSRNQEHKKTLGKNLLYGMQHSSFYSFSGCCWPMNFFLGTIGFTCLFKIR